MDGQIYRLNIRGHFSNLPHPHVVLIELEKECWVIPAFGDDGPEVQRAIRAYDCMGFDTASVAVHMDNVQHVTYKAGYKGIRAYWVVARAFKITKKLLTSYEFLGQMDDVGLVLLAQAVQRLAESKPDFISPSLKKKVGKLIESLTPKET